MDGLKLEGIRLNASEAARELHRLSASRASIEPNSNHLRAEEIRLTSTLEGDREVVAVAERGIIPMSGQLPAEDPNAEEPTLESLSELRAYAENFRQKAIYGDVFLEGNDLPVRAELAGDGELMTSALIWSRLFDLVVIPTKFIQTGRAQGNANVVAEAAACLVDKGFTTWTYFATEERPIRIVYTMPPAEAHGSISEE